jgi:serine/threonine-protein kinase RsbW
MTFPASLDSLHPLLHYLLEQLAPMAFTPKALRNIELAVEEAVVNIINHGYQHQPGDIQIHVHLFQDSHALIEIADTAQPFNPLEYNGEIDPSKIGGLGIHMIKKCVDSAEYKRRDDHNVLILKKNLQM